MSRTVIVCGGRDQRDYGEVARVLNDLHVVFPFGKVAHGGARGVDSFADRWAKANNIPVVMFPADWKRYGNSAGPIRNETMLSIMKPHLVIAFPGGKGTKNMVRLARKAAVPVVEIPVESSSFGEPEG